MTTIRRFRLSALFLVALIAGCGAGTPSPSTTEQPTATPVASDIESPAESPSAPATDAPSGEPSGDPSAEPTGDIGAPFTCELPIVDAGTAPLANIVDIRTATHDGYDRFVFEFEQGTPELTLDRAEPPFTQDASGMPIDVEGESFLGLVMRGGTKQTDAGTSSYDGPTDFSEDFPMLRHAVEAGDFERQSTWIFGLANEACVRVQILDGPPRLVVDVEH